MAGTTSIASRVAQLKRLKRDASPRSQQATSADDARAETDEDALMAMVEAETADRAVQVNEAEAEVYEENSALNDEAAAFDAAISGEFAPPDLPDDPAQDGSNFLLIDEESEDRTVADDPVDDSSSPEAGAKPAPSYDDFTDAYDAAESEQDAPDTSAAAERDATDLSMEAAESDLPEMEFADEDVPSAFEDDAFLKEFEASSTNAFNDEPLPDLEDDELVLDSPETLELDETVELSDEIPADISGVVPDFAAQEVDELVLASELEAEQSSEAAPETLVSPDVDAPEAPFSAENDAGEVAVTFDLHRANSLKEFSRDMNCSIEDIVVTALDWYLDALFNEEEEARSA